MKNRKQYEFTKKEVKEYSLSEYYAQPLGESSAGALFLGSDEAEARKRFERLTTTYFIGDYSDDEIKEFWEGIDIAPVNEFFSKLLGVKTCMEKSADRNYNETLIFKLEDKTELVKESPILAAAWKSMKVDSFGCNVTVNEKNGALHAWARIHLSYIHHDGGSNGAEIGSAYYENGEWIIRSAKGEVAERKR